MTARYVLIRYRDSEGNPKVGSGCIVRDSVVLTANHVANGFEHKIEYDSGLLSVDATKTVLSGTNEVDLGMLEIAGNPLELEQLSFAQVARHPMTINGCTAVGFPRWIASTRYLTKQVDGLIRTADQVPMDQAGGADGQLLRLTINWHSSDQRVPVPDGQLDEEPESPWGGMSGAAVTISDGSILIGVVHSHNYACDPDVLTVTPLLALKRLPGEKQRQFCDALGIPAIDDLPVAARGAYSRSPGRVTAGQPGQLPGPASSAPVFSDGVRDNFLQELASLGLRVPSPGDCAALERLYRDCEQRIMLQGIDPDLRRARDLTKAHWLAASALPLLDRFGGAEIDIRKLQYLYQRHVKSPPDSAALDGMLVRAAEVGIRQTYRSANERGLPRDETVTALARFMLGIASFWKALKEPGTVVDLGEIKSWLREHLALQASDIEKYLDRMRQRFLALIELVGPDEHPETRGSAVREMPTAIIIQIVWETGQVETERIPCQPASEQEVEDLLRDCLKPWLSDGNFIVELLLPKDWLDARVEHWNLLEVVGSLESLSKEHDPHLRWARHRPGGQLADRLEERFASIEWMDSPEDIPPDVTNDLKRLKAWHDGRNQPETQDPPYFIGSSHGAWGHDPLGCLLREGYGFLTWFTEEAKSPVRQEAADVADAFRSAWERKDGLPRQLAADLRSHKPIIIWSDPGKREDFGIPRTNSKSPRRSVRT